MSDAAHPRDAAQELAERVATKWFPGDDGVTYAEERDQLIRVIVTELLAGGWVKSAGPHVSSEELMGGIQ